MPLYFTMKLTIQKGLFNLYKSTRNPNFLLVKFSCEPFFIFNASKLALLLGFCGSITKPTRRMIRREERYAKI
ncbi:hypothetical protein Hdeb2414_s0007g00262741 [Helianthus debilis subsp. tardiflorus]